METQQRTTLIRRLTTNLADVENDPSTPLDHALFEECTTIASARLTENQSQLLETIAPLARVLPKLQQDPSPVVLLLTKLTAPLSFTDILHLDPPVDFVAGLNVVATPFNGLALDLLAKAADSPKDAAHVAGMPQVIYSLVYLWHVTENVGIATRAGDVLLALLTTDHPSSETSGFGVDTSGTLATAGGQGLVWRRCFGDRDVYGLLFSICSTGNHGEQSMSKRAKTVAQARVLAIVPELGKLDWEYLVRSHHPDVERLYGLADGEVLLDYICSHLVDVRDDVLVHMNLLQFFVDLITKVRLPAQEISEGRTILSHKVSVSLQFLRTRGHHSRSLAIWLGSDDSSIDTFDRDFLYGHSADYLSTYASLYPQAFVDSSDAHDVLIRLSNVLDISASQWAHGQARKHDLVVLASVPRIVLLPQSYLGMGRQSSPLLRVPCKLTNAHALQTLALIFKGPSRDAYENEPDGVRVALYNADWEAECAAARAAYLMYQQYHDDFFTDVLNHADIVTLPENAYAACSLLSSIITADFRPLPSNQENAYDESEPPTTLHALPDTAKFLSLLRLPANATSPALSSDADMNGILVSPAREKVLPWLLKPRQPGNSLSAKYGMDSANYKLWRIQWDVFNLFYSRLKRMVETRRGEGGVIEPGAVGLAELEAILQAAEQKLQREDPRTWRPEASAEVATMGA